MLYIFIFALAFILFDQGSKYYIVEKMTLGQSSEIISNFFSITSHRNRGAAWGILQDSRLFFLAVTVLFLAILFYYMYNQKNTLTKFDILTFSLIMGGAIGNFIDRLIRHEVVDFLDFRIFSYDFPIFNIADSSLTIGVILIIIALLKEAYLKLGS